MEDQAKPHIVSADRLDGSLIITFSDGQCGMYSSALLYKILPQAEELIEAGDHATGDDSRLRRSRD